jgi:outer membrane protein OmpA-like peptidoglycan-associated protein
VRVRVSALALSLAALPALIFAYPGFGGGKGLFRVQNAMVEEEAGLMISLHALARNAEFYTPEDAPNSSAWVADVIAPELSYAPIVTEYVGLELFGTWGGAFQMPKSYSEDGFDWGFGDLKAGGKLSVPIIPVLKIGGTANYTFKYRDDKVNGFLDREALPYSTNDKLAWSGLVTLRFQDLLTSAPNLIVNYGKVGGMTQYAAAVELQGTGFGIFVEGVSLQRTGTDIFGITNGHLYITPGIILGNSTDGFLKLGYALSSGNESSGNKVPNEFIAGFGMATPFGKHAPAVYGQILGTVVDANTGAPVAAKVAFPDNPKLGKMATDASGIFHARKVPIGAVTVEVSADGYNRQAVPLAVEKDQVAGYQFKLRPLKSYGTIAGTVTDAVTSMPIAATIAFPGTNIANVTADPGNGSFRVDKVETGVYTLTAGAENYIPATRTVSVEDGKLTNAVFMLNSAVSVTPITGKVSDKKTGEPLAAKVTFSAAAGSPTEVATDPATGVYRAQLAPSSYAATIEAEGYVKQTAALIIEKDKPTVRDFELVKVGMSITLKGIYFDFNQATIKPESRPALDDAAKILNDNPTIKVEIQGHTDSVGSADYNLRLSNSRAQAVVNYLVQNYGIAVNRLTARGYGKTIPIADNSTEEGRALNRRVEFVILKEQ